MSGESMSGVRTVTGSATGKTLRMRPVVVGVLACSLLLGGCELMLSPEKRLARAQASLEAGDTPAAVVDLKNILQKEPDNGRARLLLATASLAQGDVSGAEIALEKVDPKTVPAAEFQPVFWKLRLVQRKYDEAITGLAGPVEGLSDTGRLVLLGSAYAGSGQAVPARDAFERALAADGTNVEAEAALALAIAQQGDADAALARLEKARAANPKSSVLARAQGDMLLRRSRLADAEKAYREAAALASPKRDLAEYLGIHAGLGDALLAQSKFDDAAAVVKQLEKSAPSAGITFLLKGRVAAAQKNYPAAAEAFQKLLNADPENAQIRTLLAAVNLEQGSLEQAATNLRRVLAANADFVPARRLLAQVQMAQGRAQDAQETLAQLDGAAGSSPEIALMRVRAALASGDTAGAVKILEQLEAQGVPTEAARLDLAGAYIAAGRADRAIKLIDASPDPGSDRAEQVRLIAQASTDRPAAIRALNDYAERNAGKVPAVTFAALTLAALGETNTARARLEKLAEAAPKDAGVQVNLARVEARAGRLDAAEAALKRAAELAPSVEVYVGLAELAATRGRDAETVRWLEQARTHDPKATGPRFLLVRAYLAQNQADAAQKVADELIALTPGRPEARVLSAGVALARKDQARALADANEAVKIAPDSLEAWLAKGEVHERGGQREEARTAFRRALAVAPQSTAPAAALARLELAAGNPDAALEAARRAQQSPETRLEGMALEGDVMMQLKRPADAAKVYEQLQAARPSTQGVVRLYSARRAAGATAPEQALADWLRTNPDDVSVRLVLAEHWQGTGEQARAAGEYEALLERQPNNAIALNNLAWLYSLSNDARALPTARKAYELAPRVPAIADTLGWILVNNGQVDEGTVLLREAAKAAPDAKDIQYHLAAALARQQKGTEARQILERILADAAPFEARARATELSQSLAAGGGSAAK
jgi:putative PEP-CTERM system TPR-repeat lipoprotein